MATEVDICNLALARLGDSATVSSIDPPEGSAQAAHCARFYPMARDTMLGSHAWGFSTVRTTLSLLAAAPLVGWAYAYAVPSDAINVKDVFNSESIDDYDPQPFETETLADGTEVIYTNITPAIARYSKAVTDPSHFPPLFVEALSWLLASDLAGPVLKGETGATASTRCYAMYNVKLREAKAADASQRLVRPTHSPTWIKGR